MHILCVLTRSTQGHLHVNLFREVASYFGVPDASLNIGGSVYFVHFIHRRLGALDEQTRREAIALITNELEVRYNLDSWSAPHKTASRNAQSSLVHQSGI
jgi:hypothetical protein